MNNPLTEFKEKEVLPRLMSGYIRNALPSYDFKEKSDRWASPCYLNGERSSDPDKSYIYKNLRDGGKLHENGGGENSIIDIYANGKDFPTALRELADICGIGYLFPEYDSEKYKEDKERQAKREEANTKFISALWSGTPEANRHLDYLRSRKWTDEEIKKVGFGFADEKLVKLLPYYDTHSKQDGKTNTLIGSSHRLTIPYRGGTSLYGFKFRDIDHSNKEAEAKAQGKEYKIKKYQNTYELSRNSGLFGIPVAATEIVIVEGELDALHAIAKGADNVVASTGGRATDLQIEDAIKRGVKKFTLLYDNDEAGRSYINPTLDAIERRGQEAYIAYLPDEVGVKDTDDYLALHTLEEWKKIVREATPSYLYRYYEIYNKYVAIENKGEFSDKAREDFFSEVEALLNSAPMIDRPYNREYLITEIKATEEGLRFKVEDFQAYADKGYLRQQEKNRKAEVERASANIASLLRGGKVDEALKLMSETATKEGAKNNATEFAKVFSPNLDFDKYLSEIPEGIPTGILFKEGKNEERLTLNSGLTFICGYRGHGKTSFLNNIALNEAKRNIALRTGKSVLYFSYEVDKRRLIADLLNTFVDDPELQRSRTPIDAIYSYFKGNGERFFSSERRADGKTHFEHFKERKETFSRDYINSGALVIVDENYKVEKLLDAIRYYLTISSPSIICIDYAQLLYSEDYSRMRTEEIKKVVNDIKDFANKVGIPFVLAAQFNREVYTPVSVDTRNIGEGGDFERIADTCIGLFNLKELKPIGGKNGKDEEAQAKKLLSRLTGSNITDLEAIPNKLFVRLMKRRYGYYPIDTLLDWEGRTKKIALNDEANLLKISEPEEDNVLPF